MKRHHQRMLERRQRLVLRTVLLGLEFVMAFCAGSYLYHAGGQADSVLCLMLVILWIVAVWIPPAVTDKERKEGERAVELIELVEELRASEGDAVTIVSDNADFDGPNSVVECEGDWTGWEHRRFEGD